MNVRITTVGFMHSWTGAWTRRSRHPRLQTYPRASARRTATAPSSPSAAARGHRVETATGSAGKDVLTSGNRKPPRRPSESGTGALARYFVKTQAVIKIILAAVVGVLSFHVHDSADIFEL